MAHSNFQLEKIIFSQVRLADAKCFFWKGYDEHLFVWTQLNIQRFGPADASVRLGSRQKTRVII